MEPQNPTPSALVSELERGSVIPGRPNRIALAAYIRTLEAKLEVSERDYAALWKNYEAMHN